MDSKRNESCTKKLRFWLLDEFLYQVQVDEQYKKCHRNLPKFDMLLYYYILHGSVDSRKPCVMHLYPHNGIWVKLGTLS